MGDRSCFAIVFEGDITKLSFNPLKGISPYGKPIASGMGNPFDVIENVHELDDAATKLLAAISKMLDKDD